MRTFSKFMMLAALGGLVFLVGLRSRAELSATEGRAYFLNGAKVVDVRTVDEFKAQSLTNVINIPLTEVTSRFPTVFTNKSEVILLHCRTGRRSGLAEKELRALGYTNVFNIGSFEQARKILNSPESK